MRYQVWDVLLFPQMSKAPLQEFKTACHVVHDQDFLNIHNNMLLLPVVTCFVPALQVGQPFRISIHCWETPELSRVAQSFGKQSDLVNFQARVFIDGKLAGAQLFRRTGDWPAIIDTTLEFDKNGDIESLKFPAFHRELLTQNYWNAGDELGRIKVVISEGFCEDPTTSTFERLKNIVAFSFQHAPIDILEASSLAWPNPSMWSQISYVAQYQGTSPRRAPESGGPEAHSHSPRHQSIQLARPALPIPVGGTMLPPNQVPFPKLTAGFDPFTEPNIGHNQWRQTSFTDVSMPDYSSSESSRRVTDPITAHMFDRRYETMQSVGAYESICEALLPAAPTNTPQNLVEGNGQENPTSNRYPSPMPLDQANVKLEESIGVSVPEITPGMMGNIKSRKENMQNSPKTSDTISGDVSRKFAQPFMCTSGGTKRQRVVTPAAFKAIDDEDEPRSSPTSRKTSHAKYVIQDTRDGERQVLSGIEPNIP